MATISRKFSTLIQSARKELLNEDIKVSGREGTELPDADIEKPVDGTDTPPQDVPQDDFSKPENTEQSFTDREIDILNVALQLYRNNPQNDIQKKNEFSDLFQNGEYEDLLRSLISIADGFEI